MTDPMSLNCAQSSRRWPKRRILAAIAAATLCAAGLLAGAVGLAEARSRPATTTKARAADGDRDSVDASADEGVRSVSDTPAIHASEQPGEDPGEEDATIAEGEGSDTPARPASALPADDELQSLDSLPACLDETMVRAVLGRGIDIARRRYPDLRMGLLVRRDDDRHVIYAADADLPLIPASTTKLVSSAVALHHLGPAHRLTTRFLHRRGDRSGGVIAGPLYVKGGGDPSLVYEQLWRIARVIRRQGVAAIKGGLVVDQGLFASGKIPGSDFERNDQPYQAPVAPFSVNFNAFELHIRPGPSAGAKGVVETEPDLPEFFKIDNQLVTTARGAALTVILRADKDGVQRITVKGRIGVNERPQILYRAVGSPWRYAAETLRAMLKQAGVAVDGALRVGPVPANAIMLHEQQSLPVGELALSINKDSSNFIAETLLLVAAATTKGAPGDWVKAAALQREFLEDRGLWHEGLVLENGSGLTLNNRLSARAMVGVLDIVGRGASFAVEYAASMSLGGQDGTLRRRLKSLPSGALLRAKTGTIEDAVSLAGHLTTARGVNLTFAVLLNAFPRQQRPEAVAFMDWCVSVMSRLAPEHDACFFPWPQGSVLTPPPGF